MSDYTTLGQDLISDNGGAPEGALPEELQIKHAMQMGVHDAAKDLTRYAILGGTILIIGYVFFGQNMISRLKRRIVG